MSAIAVHVVHAFDHLGGGGNPAGVVLDADNLSQREKQAIAASAALSEIAFVSSSKVADFRLEFFTPNRQIPHCGHATIATFSYLRQVGLLHSGTSSKETIDGRRDILIDGDTAFMEQRPPAYLHPEDVAAHATPGRIAASLGAYVGSLVEAHPAIICSTGNRFLLVAVRDANALASITPNLAKIESISQALDLIGYYVWTSIEGPCHATARMFAPSYGIAEESGSGMAAGPLACYLYEKCNICVKRILIAQGAFMNPPSPSRLTVDLHVDSECIQRVFVGGTARYVRTLQIQVPHVNFVV